METSLSRTALLASQVSSEGRDYQEIFCATCGFLRSDDVFEARSVELPEQDGDAYKLAIASLNNQLDDYEEVVSKMRDDLATLPE